MFPQPILGVHRLNHVYYCNGILYLRLVNHLFVYRYYDKKTEQHRKLRYALHHTLQHQGRQHEELLNINESDI